MLLFENLDPNIDVFIDLKARPAPKKTNKKRTRGKKKKQQQKEKFKKHKKLYNCLAYEQCSREDIDMYTKYWV